MSRVFRIDHTFQQPLARQVGFSLVELMIALALGLLLIAAIGSIYIGSTQSYRTHGSLAQVQESGRFAHLLVVPIVRQAGYLPNPLIQVDPTQRFRPDLNKLAVYGIDNADGSLPRAADYPGFDPRRVVPGTDVLAIAFQGRSVDRSASVPQVDTPLRTCLGRAVETSQIAINIFFVGNDDSGTPNLYCYDNITALADPSSTNPSTSMQPLVSGVTDLQVLYGLDSGGGPGAASAQVVAAGAVADWTQVTRVQLDFTVVSTNATEQGRNGPGVATGNQRGKLLQRYSTVVQIRNRLGS